MSKLGITPWDIVRVVPFEEGGLIDATTEVNSDGTIEVFVNEDGDSQSARFMKNTEGQKDVLREYLPSLYTGGMRKLMQVSHLRGASGLSSARHDLFLPNWSDTYGIWISSPVDGFCNRYVIRVCTSGVYRIPIRFSQPLPANWRDLEAEAMTVPAEEAAQTLGRMWSAGNFDPSLAVKIADTPLMYENEEGSFYGTCGWAFNSDGSAAVNTGVRIDPDDPFEARKRASLYRIDITEEGGIPVSASCSQVESGELVNHFDDTDENEGPAILQVPSGLSGERGVCKTFSCYPGTIGPRLFSTNTPVFAYYDDTDAMHVVRFTPTWSTTSSSSSTTMAEARGSLEHFPDMWDGDNTGTANYYGSDPAWPFVGTGYPDSVMSATWGSDSTTRARTMCFTSPLITPLDFSRASTKVDSSFQTLGSILAESGNFAFPFIGIDWMVTQTDINSGTVATFRDNRISGIDSFAAQRATSQGVVTYSRSYSEEQRNHQVLVLHGYDRTSYAVYSRENNVQTGITFSYGGTNMAVPDPSTLQYNGNFSGGAWVAHQQSTYDSDEIVGSPPQHVVRDCVGVSKLPEGMVLYRPDNGNSVTPPGGGSESNINTTVRSGKVIVGGVAYDLSLTGGTIEDVFIDATFYYKSGGSVRNDRAFYQDHENLTPANVVGVGSYPETSGNVTAFVGWF